MGSDFQGPYLQFVCLYERLIVQCRCLSNWERHELYRELNGFRCCATDPPRRTFLAYDSCGVLSFKWPGSLY